MNEDIVVKVISGSMTKADAARACGVSPRTIGRWVAKYNQDVQEIEVEDEIEDLYSSDFDDEHETEYNCVATKNSISITKVVDGVIDGNVSIDRSNSMFKESFTKIAESGFDNDVLEEIYISAQPRKMVESFTEGKLKIDVVTNSIMYIPDVGPEFPVSGLLASRIVETIRAEGVDGARKLITFMNALMENPSRRAVNELYGFLTHNDIEITDDGYFYAWKKVRDTYFDIHSNTMDNSPGKELRVERNMVDEDSDRTCSHGLHVCAKSYLSHFGGSESRVVKVKVHPKDVVAIPKDYNDSKMRCCGYIVVEDVTDSF
jgi:hypothetical protein